MLTGWRAERVYIGTEKPQIGKKFNTKRLKAPRGRPAIYSRSAADEITGVGACLDVGVLFM